MGFKYVSFIFVGCYNKREIEYYEARWLSFYYTVSVM
jgi:hypothetical protein